MSAIVDDRQLKVSTKGRDGYRMPITISPRLWAMASVPGRCLHQLDVGIDPSPLEAADRLKARQEDRQGLGLSRRAVQIREVT